MTGASWAVPMTHAVALSVHAWWWICIPSQSVLPGSFMCMWASMSPGEMRRLPKSKWDPPAAAAVCFIAACAERGLMLVILPPCTQTASHHHPQPLSTAAFDRERHSHGSWATVSQLNTLTLMPCRDSLLLVQLVLAQPAADLPGRQAIACSPFLVHKLHSYMQS